MGGGHFLIKWANLINKWIFLKMNLISWEDLFYWKQRQLWPNPRQMAKTWKCFLVPPPSHKHNPHPDNCGPPNATIWEEFIVYFFNWSYSPVKSLRRVWLFATPWTVHQPPGSSVCGIFQARILEWVAISFSRNWTQVFCITGGFSTVWATREGASWD